MTSDNLDKRITDLQLLWISSAIASGLSQSAGKSADSTSASKMAKHFRHDFPFHREIRRVGGSGRIF